MEWIMLWKEVDVWLVVVMIEFCCVEDCWGVFLLEDICRLLFLFIMFKFYCCGGFEEFGIGLFLRFKLFELEFYCFEGGIEGDLI